MLATIAGKTPSQIARSDGTSKQAVAQTLQSKRVSDTLRRIIDRTQTIRTDTQTGEKTSRPLIEEALLTISALLHAKKPVIYGATYAMVPDNAMRLQAAAKIIEIYEPAGLRAHAEPAPEELAIEETTSTRRVARRRVR